MCTEYHSVHSGASKLSKVLPGMYRTDEFTPVGRAGVTEDTARGGGSTCMMKDKLGTGLIGLCPQLLVMGHKRGKSLG